jgi:hypothetical protein
MWKQSELERCVHAKSAIVVTENGDTHPKTCAEVFAFIPNMIIMK